MAGVFCFSECGPTEVIPEPHWRLPDSGWALGDRRAGHRFGALAQQQVGWEAGLEAVHRSLAEQMDDLRTAQKVEVEVWPTRHPPPPAQLNSVQLWAASLASNLPPKT